MPENRFKKSVDKATANTLYNIQDNILDNITDNILDNIKSNILETVTLKEKKSRGGNYTFYLSPDVADALNKLSGKTGQSKSTLVNGILKAVIIENSQK